MRPTLSDRHVLNNILISAQLEIFLHNGGKITRRRSRK